METTAWQNITTPATSTISTTPPVLRLFVPSGTTTVYLVGYYVGTITVAYGRISARRAT
jgi:hypothetical protein